MCKFRLALPSLKPVWENIIDSGVVYKLMVFRLLTDMCPHASRGIFNPQDQQENTLLSWSWTLIFGYEARPKLVQSYIWRLLKRALYLFIITKTNEIKIILINTPSTQYFLLLKNFQKYHSYGSIETAEIVDISTIERGRTKGIEHRELVVYYNEQPW